MGMLIDGKWNDSTDRFMQGGKFLREQSQMPTDINGDTQTRLCDSPTDFVLVASSSCPWSHGATLAYVLKGWANLMPLQMAGGPRVEGYALLPDGPLTSDTGHHLHQFYTQTITNFTGRVTVPLLWDVAQARIISNSSADIMAALNQRPSGPDLLPEAIKSEIEALIPTIFDGLSNAVYRAGMAERQDEYDSAVNTVFATMDMLNTRLSDQAFLFGPDITVADIRLFASLVRFDTVYATHFRCTRKRLVDYTSLWRFTRRIYQMPGVQETIDFDEIRFGYYVNDGSHNPFGIIGQQPDIDWLDKTGL
ncbi:MAG: glutathione S-transferase C-terminal domain-containing protein [Rhodobacteraceae bacterium]|nr:glutathione S-transferase C-terminal domain-containing protein [Paracoccaceae bacterium]